MPQVPPTTMTSNPLAAMLNLQRRQSPQVNLEADRTSRLREMLRNLEMAKGNPAMTVGATPSDVIGLQSDIEEDPYTGEAADEEVAYAQPLAVARREETKQDALARLLLPIQERNRGALDVANVNTQGRVAAAEAAAAQRAAQSQQAQQFRGSQAQTAIQNRERMTQNAGLEKQAVAREKQGGYDFWNSLLGRQTNAQAEAAALRAKMVPSGTMASEPSGEDPGAIAAQLFAKDPSGAAKLPSYLASHGMSPEEVTAIVEAYRLLGGQ